MQENNNAHIPALSDFFLRYARYQSACKSSDKVKFRGFWSDFNDNLGETSSLAKTHLTHAYCHNNDTNH